MSEHRVEFLSSNPEILMSRGDDATTLRRALVRILAAAEGNPRFQPMNWSDVAEVARQALGADPCRADLADRA